MDLKKTLLSVIVSLHTVAFASESATQRPTKSEQAITDSMEIEKAAKPQGQLVTDRFTELAKGLREMLALEDAYAFADALHNDLTKKADFSLLVSGHTAEAAPLISALISVEKFRAFETQQGLLFRSDPSPLDYYVPGTANITSQAVLVSLATAIQKSLLNPKATAANLLDLVRYQKNSRSLKAIQPAIESLFTTGSINLLINEKLIEQIRKISLKISAMQKAAIGKEATSQQLITYNL